MESASSKWNCGAFVFSYLACFAGHGLLKEHWCCGKYSISFSVRLATDHFYCVHEPCLASPFIQGGNLDCIHILATVNRAAMTMDVQSWLGALASNSLGTDAHLHLEGWGGRILMNSRPVWAPYWVTVIVFLSNWWCSNPGLTHPSKCFTTTVYSQLLHFIFSHLRCEPIYKICHML